MSKVIEEICAQFDLGKPASTTEAGGTRNVTYIVETDRGKWVLRRRYAGYCDPGRLAFDHGAAVFLAAKGVPVVPPRAAADGDTFVRHDGEVWEAYSFVEGRHLRDGNRPDVIALADSLAKFHHAGGSFQGRCDKLGPRGETDPDHLLESIARVRIESPDAQQALDAYEQAVAEAAGELGNGPYALLPHTLVHGDAQPANIMMRDGEVAAFVDLDWVAWRPRIYDLCFAILCCCARHEHPLADGDVWSLTQTPHLDYDVIQEFLEAYQRASAPLRSAESAALWPQLTLSWCHVRVDNCLKVPAEQRLEFLSR